VHPHCSDLGLDVFSLENKSIEEERIRDRQRRTTSEDTLKLLWVMRRVMERVSYFHFDGANTPTTQHDVRYTHTTVHFRHIKKRFFSISFLLVIPLPE
jgi:hypothetical protein